MQPIWTTVPTPAPNQRFLSWNESCSLPLHVINYPLKNLIQCAVWNRFSWPPQSARHPFVKGKRQLRNSRFHDFDPRPKREAQWLISYDPLLWPSVFDTLRCGERAIPQNIPYHHIPYTTPYIYIYINHISHIKKYKYIYQTYPIPPSFSGGCFSMRSDLHKSFFV